VDTLLNIRAFLATARAGSLSGAARNLGVAASVISKRLNRLEDEMHCQLFVRSTRKLELTETGNVYLPRYQALVAEIDEALAGAKTTASRVEGHLRIKCPTTLAVLHFGDILSDFQKAFPAISLDIVLMDRSVNPIEEGFDVAFGALPGSYANVVNEPLCIFPRVLCAAPSYLERHGEPKHPRDLIKHDCLVFTAIGLTWSFDGPGEPIRVEVRSRFSTNDSQVLLNATLKGLGVTIIGRYVAEEPLADGRLRSLLDEYPVSNFWLKAFVPESKFKRASVQALLNWVKARVQPTPPWKC
jgi:DNA-binding transcriptional LysR family regulator